jgi:diguanylate cyclase (GGDEF)-like protein
MLMRILLIDDDEVDRRAVRRALKNSELFVEIEEASDAQSAISLFDESPFDCVLLDYRLPDTDGISVAQDLLSRNKGPAIPIVMLTGEGNETVAVEAMKSGVQDYLPKNSLDSNSLSRAINNAVEKTRLHNRIEELNRRFEQMALIDSLTGLGNRNLFSDRLNSLIATCKRSNQPFSLLMMDLNKFKEVNDNHGHDAGDEVLRVVGKRLTALSRDADGFFRLGGDEFAALVSTGATREGLTIIAERILDELKLPIEYNSTRFKIGVSIGIVLFPEHGVAADELLRLADAAMYEAKRGQLGFLILSSTENSVAR